MSAFDKGTGGMGDEADINDIFSAMFGGMGMPGGMSGTGGMGGMGGMGAGTGARRRRHKGENEEQEYEVTLEELYKGKTTKFSCTKNTICTTCQGSGGREKAKPKRCGTCGGLGMTQTLQQIGPGLVTPTTVSCAVCGGRGHFFREKERCKKCKGNRTVKQRKMLELYIPPGSRQGEQIVLMDEADQQPDQEPGDLVFHLVETQHETFRRAGADLTADLNITLAEALTGFDRVILRHLDGRGIHLSAPERKGQILRPGQTLKVRGEGMPIKRSSDRGDLYLQVNVEFPQDGWFTDPDRKEQLRSILPRPRAPIMTEEIDEVNYESHADMKHFYAGSGDPRSGAEWEDDDDAHEQPDVQCAHQ